MHGGSKKISFKPSAINSMQTILSVNKSREKKIIPRPWSTIRAHPKRNHILIWNYCVVGTSYNGEQWVLVLRDASSSYYLLHTCENPSAEYAASCMLEWNSLFEMPEIWPLIVNSLQKQSAYWSGLSHRILMGIDSCVLSLEERHCTARH